VSVLSAETALIVSGATLRGMPSLFAIVTHGRTKGTIVSYVIVDATVLTKRVAVLARVSIAMTLFANNQ